MYARVATLQFPPGPADKMFRFMDEHARPALLAQGCVEIDTLYDAQTGRAHVITFWKDADATLSSEGFSNQLREQARKELGFQILDVSVYEVTVEVPVTGPQPRAARVTAAQGDPARADELARWTETQLLSAYRAQPGFCGWHTLTDRKAGKSLIMSLWRDDAAMQAAETLLTQSRARGAQEQGLTFEPTERFEVGVSTMPMGAPIQQQQYEEHP